MNKYIPKIILIALIAIPIYLGAQMFGLLPISVPYSEFTTAVDTNVITEAEIDGNTVIYKIGTVKRYETHIPEITINALSNTFLEQNVALSVTKTSTGAGIGTMIMISIIPVMLLIGAMFYFAKTKGEGGPFGKFGKSKGRWVNHEDNTVRMSDIAISDGELSEVSQLVDFLKDPKKYTGAGGKLPKGFLMDGPPGVGKTLIAKAIAGESGAKYYEVAGSEFDEMLVGAGASRVKDMFEDAKKNAPCILFIDEIDALAKRRDVGTGKDSGQTVGQLLVEMDGFNNRDGIVIIAATNRPDMLDPAVTRPGRFDRHIHIGLPDLAGRVKILKVHGEKINLSKDADLKVIARGTTYFSGADLANLINEGAIRAGSEGRDLATQADLEYARDKIIMGAENARIMSDKEKELTAYHEAGHVIVGNAQPDHDPVYKVSIIPRGRALGVTAYLPEEERYSQNLRLLESRIQTLFGGRIAEQLVFGDYGITTGASNDLERATEICRNMVNKWGFSELGVMSIDGESSDETKRRADMEVSNILNSNYQAAKFTLNKNRAQLDMLAKALLAKETLDADEVNEILHRTKV